MAQSSAHNWGDNESRTADVLSATPVTFGDMMLRDGTIKGLSKAGFQTCSPIQTRAIPLARSGLDLLVQAKSGTGKTLVFAVCILEAFKVKAQGPQSLVIAPTREIAVQIKDTLICIGASVPEFKVESFIGGLDIDNDRPKIQNCSAVIGTPGRLLHLIKNNVLNVKTIKLLVLDEADSLMADSFRKDIMAISSRLTPDIQTLALSATFENGVDRQLAKMMQQPIGVTPKREVPILLGVKQFGMVLPPPVDSTVVRTSMQEMNAKVKAIATIFERVSFKQCLIFMNSNQRAESYGNYLSQNGWPTDVMMSRMDQSERLHTYKRFKSFDIRILVCTDLMARGIDSKSVNLVINLDVPTNSTIYLHRIGRAGRFGTRGMSVTLMTDAAELQKMAMLLGSLGGRETFITKFPDVGDVDMWEYDTKDVREKYFGVELCSAKRTEQVSMKAIERKKKKDKKLKQEDTQTVGDVESVAMEPPAHLLEAVAVNVEPNPCSGVAQHVESVAMESQALLPTPTGVGNIEECSKAEPSIAAPQTTIDKAFMAETPEPNNWDALMAKLTSNSPQTFASTDPLLTSLAKDNVSAPAHRNIVEDNQQLLAAAKWMLDDMPNKPKFGLHLPMDLFGHNDLTDGSTNDYQFLSSDIMDGESNVVVEQTPPSKSTGLNLPMDLFGPNDHTDGSTMNYQCRSSDIVNGESDIVLEQTTPDTRDTTETNTVNADSTNSDPANGSIDRLLFKLFGDSDSDAQTAPVDIPDNKLIELLTGGVKTPAIQFDANLFGCAPDDAIVPSDVTDPQVITADYVPDTGRDPKGESSILETPAKLDPDNTHTVPAAVNCLNVDSDDADDNKLSDFDACVPNGCNGTSNHSTTATVTANDSAQAIRKPSCQPSNIPGIMWRTVTPQEEHLPYAVANENLLADDNGESDDADSVDDEQEGAIGDNIHLLDDSVDDKEEGAIDGSQQYFQAGLNTEHEQPPNGNLDKAKRLWKSTYERQLQQIQSYVQYTEVFNRAFPM